MPIIDENTNLKKQNHLLFKTENNLNKRKPPSNFSISNYYRNYYPIIIRTFIIWTLQIFKNLQSWPLLMSYTNQKILIFCWCKQKASELGFRNPSRKLFFQIQIVYYSSSNMCNNGLYLTKHSKLVV